MGQDLKNAHITFFFRHFESILFEFFFFEYVVDELLKTNSSLVLQETPPPAVGKNSIVVDKSSILGDKKSPSL